MCREMLVPATVTSLAAVALVVAPRWFAWTALLALPAAFAWVVSRSAGIVAALSAATLYLLAHGRPRFASTVTDPLTIRLAFLLGLLGAGAAVLADWRRCQRAEAGSAAGVVPGQPPGFGSTP